MSIKKIMRTAVACAAVSAAGAASAAVITLDFEGLQSSEAVLDFYNGGAGGNGSTGGTNHGIAFGANSLALIDADAGGTGNFANEPSPSTILFFLSGSAVLNYAPGFTTGFSFWYTSTSFAGSVNVYDGLDATGNLVGSIALPALGTNCQGDPSGDFCNWSVGSLAFAGTARSVDFGGTVDQIGYDDITFGSATPGGPGGTVPEPGSLALVGAALAGLALARRRRR